MNDLEQLLQHELKKSVPGNGMTPDLRRQVLRSLGRTHREPTRGWIGRLLMPGMAGAVALALAVVGIVSVEDRQDWQTGSLSPTGPGVTVRSFQSAAIALLNHYGWHPRFNEQMTQTLQLPHTYMDQPGAYPVGLYWAYHNVLSKADGLDITPYLGKTVTVHMIPVQHWTTGIYAFDTNRTTYAIVVTCQGQIVAAWISQGLNGSDYAMSLSKRFFARLTKQTWDQWLISEHLVDYQTGVDANRQSWPPEQVIHAYFSAINHKQYRLAWSLVSKSSQYQYTAMNLPQGQLYNSGYDDKYGMDNIASVKVTRIKLNDLPPYLGNNADPTAKRENQVQYDLFNMKTYGQHEYLVNVYETYKQVITNTSGPGGWYVTVVKESPDAPWKISGYGSGP